MLLFLSSLVANTNAQVIDISLVADYVSTLSAAGSFPDISGYGGNIIVENHLCKDILYDGINVITHGSFHSHCDVVTFGTKDGCQVTGKMNYGTEGMMQFEVADTGKYFNLYFRLSAGWGKENRVHVFWSNKASKNDDLYNSGCWYDHCESRGDSELVCYKWYRGDCTANHRDYPILDRYGAVQIRYNVGSGNNPDLKVELYSNVQNDAQCGRKSSAMKPDWTVSDKVSQQTESVSTAQAQAAVSTMHMQFMTVGVGVALLISLMIGCGLLIGQWNMKPKVPSVGKIDI